MRINVFVVVQNACISNFINLGRGTVPSLDLTFICGQQTAEHG